MSSHADHGHDGHASGGGLGIGTMISKVLGPQETKYEPSIMSTIMDATVSVRDAILKTIGTVASLPVAAAVATAALPNNLLGLTHQTIDRYIVSPMDNIRHTIWRLFAEPSKLLAGSGGDHHGGGHH